MAVVVQRIKSWWHKFKGDVTWRPAEEFIDYTQFERSKVEAFLRDLDLFGQELGRKAFA